MGSGRLGGIEGGTEAKEVNSLHKGREDSPAAAIRNFAREGEDGGREGAVDFFFFFLYRELYSGKRGHTTPYAQREVRELFLLWFSRLQRCGDHTCLLKLGSLLFFCTVNYMPRSFTFVHFLHMCLQEMVRSFLKKRFTCTTSIIFPIVKT